MPPGSSERWRRVGDLCEQALGLDSRARQTFLTRACGDDEALRREVESLLAQASKADGFLTPSALAAAADVVLNPPRASLTGRQIGPYDIRSQLGVGGMGEVYRARDRKLGRDVAIKVLPAHLTDDIERLARFEREARTLASLNHPHIGAIYGVEDADGIPALILELIEGETLAAALAGKPLPLERALTLAVQIAEALDHAHRRGITHRDLKPSNVMLTKTGTKLLDFGLAQWARSATAAPSTLSPTLTDLKSLTREGTILGTLNYMAPEQLEGRQVDARSDLFAFGVLLYEMVTGRRAFDGPSQASVIAAILTSQPPPPSSVRALVPVRLDRVIQKCLAKDPDDRWQSARDLADELKWIAEDFGRPVASPIDRSASRPTRPPAVGMRAVAALAVVVVAFGAWTIGRFARSSESRVTRALSRFVIQAPPTAPMTGGYAFDISPDGSQLVYVGVERGTTHLYFRRLDEFEPATILGTEGARTPFFSPDGRSVGFWADGKLKRIAVSPGASPTIVCDMKDLPFAIWATDNTIILRSKLGGGLQRVSAEGGVVRQTITTPDASRSEVDHHSPRLLPGGKALMFTVHRVHNQFQVAVIVLATGERKTLIDSVYDARYSPTGHLVYGSGRSLFAVPFDVDRLELTGAPVRLLDNVASAPSDGMVNFSLSPTGTFVYEPQPSRSGRTLVWVDRAGAQVPLPIPPRAFTSPRLSPDGRRLAFALAEGERRDIWIYDFADEKLNRVTREGDNQAPLWTRDGQRLTYTSIRDGMEHLMWQPADGIGSAESLVSSYDKLLPGAWAVDNRMLLYGDTPETSNSDILVIHVDAERRSQPLIHGARPNRQPSLSPDGRWLAFSSAETGRNEIYVDAFPALGSRRQVTVDGGREPTWSRDGRQLLYRSDLSDTRVFAVPIDTGHSFSAGKPIMLFQGRYMVNLDFGLDYDVAPDGRFLMVKPSEEEQLPPRLNVVLNWVDELTRRVPSGK